MSRTARRPLDRDAVRAADDQFYADHPELVQDGERIPLDPSAPSQADLRSEWIDLYVAKGGQVEGDEGKADKSVDAVVEPCPRAPERIRLVELVEVVARDREGSVVNPGTEATERFSKIAERTGTDDDGVNKQYVNLDPDAEGKAQRHPGYGRFVDLRARIEWAEGDPDRDLAGRIVYFRSERVPAEGAPSTLLGVEDCGFGSPGGVKNVQPATTDGDGWTEPVRFHFSRYGGDRFDLFAQADEENKGEGSGPELRIGSYAVWRKFWYQLSHAQGLGVPHPAQSETAYGKVQAEMVLAGERVFTRTDLPEDLQDRTFLPEYMVQQGGGINEVAVVGLHNVDDLAGNIFAEETSRPLKTHLVVTEYQCDATARDTSGLSEYTMTADPQEFTVSGGADVVTKPPLRGGEDLVVSGEYGLRNDAGAYSRLGVLSDDNISIESDRANAKQIRVSLPTDAPAPTKAAPVVLMLDVWTAGSYLGLSHNGNVICVYRPRTAAGLQGSEQDFNDTTTHEIGHLFNQTPQPGDEPDSLSAHPEQYVAHGGSGSHCSDGASTKPPEARRNIQENRPEAVGGTCVMFHTFNPACHHEFCSTCRPYVRLQVMSKFS